MLLLRITCGSMHLCTKFVLDIMRLKFNVQAQYKTKVNITHVKQRDSVSCGTIVCYYTEKIINGNFLFVLRLHNSETYSEPTQISKTNLFVNVINGFQLKALLSSECAPELCSLLHMTAFLSCIFIKSGTSQIWLLLL